MSISSSKTPICESLQDLLGETLSTSEWNYCDSHLQSITPSVGQFWDSQSANAGLYIILAGKVRLINVRDELVATLSEGEGFGELTLFPSAPFLTYRMRAGMGVELYFLSAQALAPLLRQNSGIKNHLLKAAQARNRMLQATTPSSSTQEMVSQAQPPLVQGKSMPSRTQVSAKRAQHYFPTPIQQAKHVWQRTLQRYPFFAQQSASDCGAACLVMIARYWGKSFSVNRLREIANVDRNGASLLGVSTAAESLGFTTKPVKATLPQLAKQSLPAIAHWEGKHYIVVYRITSRHVIIGDPAIGQLSLTHDAFAQKWTGYTLLLTPSILFKDVQEDQSNFWHFFDLLKPHSIVILEVVLASLCIQLFGLVTPLFTQLLLDRVVVQGSELTLTAIGLGLLLFSMFRVAMIGLRQYLIDHTANRLDLALIIGFIRHTFRLPLKFFESRYVGDLVSRVQENRKIERFLSGEALSILLDLFTVFVYLGLMFWYSWRLALLVLLIVPPFFLLALFATPFLQRISREIFTAMAKESSYLIESLTGIRTVKSAAVEQSVRWRWEEFFSRSVQYNFTGQVISNRLQIFSNAIEAIATTGLLWYGASLVIQQELSIGQLVAFNMLLGNIIRPFQRLIVLWNQLQEVLIAVERINDVLEAEPEEDLLSQAKQSLPKIQGDIHFQNVTFRYQTEGDTNILQNLSFRIRPGQMVALVGRSGSGKTTLSKLLLGLYPPTDGQIWIDGHDVSSLSLKSLRQQVGVVDQDTFLFGGTIRENIGLRLPEASLEEIMEVSCLAGADEFIKRLPMGYETQIGEGGGLLSGGQRQRLAIARALLGNPRLLILDEATSHLDTESERIIQQNLGQILKGRTTMVIAHRLSTIRSADIILVLDRGLLVESGTHDALMQKQGYYYYLTQQQLGSTVST